MKPVKGSFANLFPKLRQEFTLPRIRTVMMLEDSGLAPWVGIHDEAQTDRHGIAVHRLLSEDQLLPAISSPLTTGSVCIGVSPDRLRPDSRSSTSLSSNPSSTSSLSNP